MKDRVLRVALVFLVFSLLILNAADVLAKGHSGGHRGRIAGGHSSGRYGVHRHNALSGPGWTLIAYSAVNMPLGGYVVYNNDTLTGTITINNLSVAIIPADTLQPHHTFSYADKGLHTVTVFSKENGTLVLIRAKENDKELSRVIHSGKLTIYDDRYSFNPAVNLDEAHTKIVHDNRLEPLYSFVSIDPKFSLIRAVNKTYNLSLQPQDFTWPQLIYYLDRLD